MQSDNSFQRVRLVFIGTLLMGATLPVWSLTVSPGRTEIHLAPGQVQTVLLHVTNETKENSPVEVSTKDWFVLEANQAKKLTVDRWLTIKGPGSFEVKPAETRDYPVEVRVPREAQGELVGMVSFAYQTQPPSNITPVISVSLYLSVDGTEKRSGVISDIAVRHLPQAIQAVVTVKNDGNVHLRPSGAVDLLDDQGKTVDSLPIHEGGPAYPGRDTPYGAYDMALKLKPGHYTARVTLTSPGIELKAERGFTVPEKDGPIKMDDKVAA